MPKYVTKCTWMEQGNVFPISKCILGKNKMHFFIYVGPEDIFMHTHFNISLHIF